MGIKSILLAVAGVLLLLLGAIGLFLPVWPTTPFVLAAAGCLSATPRLKAVVLRMPIFREYIENYRTRSGLPRKTVVVSLSSLWGMLALSAALSQRLWLSLLLAAVGAAVTAHILTIAKSRKGKQNGG
jgi:uncharacterized membrane protein YbaN (DUF454 family)